jgi:hypothetical protein
MGLSELERERITEEERLRHETRRELERKPWWRHFLGFFNTGWFFQGVVIASALFAYDQWQKAEQRRREDAALASRLNVELRARLRPFSLALLAVQADLQLRGQPAANVTPPPVDATSSRVVRLFHEADQPEPAAHPEFQGYGLYALVSKYVDITPKPAEYQDELIREVRAIRDCVHCLREARPDRDRLVGHVDFMVKVLKLGGAERWTLLGESKPLTAAEGLAGVYPEPRLVVLLPNESAPKPAPKPAPTKWSWDDLAGGPSREFVHPPNHEGDLVPWSWDDFASVP